MMWKMPVAALTIGFVLLLNVDSNALSLTVEDGRLMGATDVIVNSELYDVSFLNGSFDGPSNPLFDHPDPFTFSTESEAFTAGQALLDQVFVAEFDTNPNLINGIDNYDYYSRTFIPFEFLTVRDTQSHIRVVEVYNYATEGPEDWRTDSLYTFGLFRVTDTHDNPWNYSVWTRSPSQAPEPVPEPGTILLLSGGLAGLAFYARRRRKE